MPHSDIPADLTVAWPGRNEPLGVTVDEQGANVAVWAENAEAVYLCLIDPDGSERQIRIKEKTFHVFHGYVPGLRPGQRYGFRVHGPWDPHRGHRFNAHKLLLDPYAKAVCGDMQRHPAIFGSSEHDDTAMNTEDSAPYVPLAVVIDRSFDWGDDRKPDTPWFHTVIYETHVKGFTMTHPEIPAKLRGTYAGLAHPAAIEHLTQLGITAVELLPVHQSVEEIHLMDAGLSNYWGYNSLAYFAPHHQYSSAGECGAQVNEFKSMVKSLHAAGIEVILDVVYNHTCEGDHLGPTLAWRGIDNPAYYRLDPSNPRLYTDYTGCGNTLNLTQPHVIRMIMDSLRYWATEMGVDGFRFDLASALARSMHDVDMLGPFMTTIAQDPVLRNVKLIAEPWDVGPGGYQVGEFPPLWTEWNGKFRDCLRDYWRSAAGVGELGWRLSGSADLYTSEGRRPYASINFITCHDGFPLQDLVSYNQKHNEANREGNRDGTDDNRSWNTGVEGPTDDPAIQALRRRRVRSMLTSLILSTGVPMLSGGDEISRTQRGNNNAYCQDNEISWFDWDLSEDQRDLLTFTADLLKLRREHLTFHQRFFFSGRSTDPNEPEDLAWFAWHGGHMTADEWNDAHTRAIGMYLSGYLKSRTHTGEPERDWPFLLLFNGGTHTIDFVLPRMPYGHSYTVLVDTTNGAPIGAGAVYRAGETIRLEPFVAIVTRAERDLEVE
jgi:glycogen operon protein